MALIQSLMTVSPPPPPPPPPPAPHCSHATLLWPDTFTFTSLTLIEVILRPKSWPLLELWAQTASCCPVRLAALMPVWTLMRMPAERSCILAVPLVWTPFYSCCLLQPTSSSPATALQPPSRFIIFVKCIHAAPGSIELTHSLGHLGENKCNSSCNRPCSTACLPGRPLDSYVTC